MGDKRYDQQIPTVTGGEARHLHPAEQIVMASAAGGILALGIAALTDQEFVRMWRWLLIGALLPLGIFMLRYTLPSLIELLEVLTQRDFTGDGVVGKPDTIRLLPVRAQSPRIKLSGASDLGYEPDDLRALIHHAYAVDYSARSFYNMTLPSGRKITGYDDLLPFLHILEGAQLLTDRAQRVKGQLHGNEGEARRLLGL